MNSTATKWAIRDEDGRWLDQNGYWTHFAHNARTYSQLTKASEQALACGGQLVRVTVTVSWEGE